MTAHYKPLALLTTAIVLTGCASTPPSNLGEIYNAPAQEIGDNRNPVIVIPGVLGTKLEDPSNNQPIWGAFTFGAADPDTAEGARLVALPMQQGVPLAQLRDDVQPTDVLDTLTLDIGLIRGVELGAYADILITLAAGKYRDETLGESGTVDYGGLHYTCFQFPYDWRRDVSEQAVALHELVLDAQLANQQARDTTNPVKVDIIAHSMGGLVLRYYLRYGPNPLPEDGSMPPLTWEGADNVNTAILVGTPSAGSVLSLEQLVKGVNFAALITPTYQPAVLGTMPSLFQLLPRTRHSRVVDSVTLEPIDIYDTDVWEQYQWGMADPDQQRILKQLLPDVPTEAQRREIAIDHLDKCLRKAEQLFAALDTPATPPAGTTIHLIAGDAIPTPDLLAVDAQTGKIHTIGTAPGDDTVVRTSALMDERVGNPYTPRLKSPIDWNSVQFLSSNHLGLTKDRAFTNFVLYTLLEKPID